MTATPPNPARPSPRIFRSLAHRNFRLFFIGQGISLIGTWMQQVALGWLVYQTTQDARKMGLVTFIGQIPSFVLVPVSGVFIERWNRHRTVIVTQALAMVQAGLLAALVLTGLIEFWHIILLSLFMGCINAVDMPARQAFLPEMLTNKEDLANAIALNSSLFNGARLVGPSLAGLLIYFAGEAMCFLLNAVSYVAVLAALLAMRIPGRPRPLQHPRLLGGLREGFRYAFGFPPIRALILLVAMVSFLGMPYAVLMPIFADRILGGGADTLGFLMTASGLGALAGAVYMAGRASVVGLGSRMVAACVLFGLGLMGFSQSESLPLSLALLALVGLGMMVVMSSCNTILQTIVEDDKRGRVMSIYTTAFMGVAPFGSLLAGDLADRIGAPTTVLICGAGCLVGTLFFARKLPALRALVRPIYVQKGVLAAPVSNLEPVTEVLAVRGDLGQIRPEEAAGEPEAVG
jgi:MFS family permease